MDTVTDLISNVERYSGLDATAVADARLVLCDLDGCLMAEGRSFFDTANFVEACGERLWIISNCSDTTALIMSQRLAGLGINVPADRILLAGEITLNYLAETEKVRRVQLFADVSLIEHAKTLGLDLTSDSPDAFLMCRDPGVTVDTMGQILTGVAKDIPLWVANEDLSHPGHDNQPIAETGALLAALLAIRPDLLWRSLGKPGPTMLRMALARSGLNARDAVFVGDNILTDGRAASALGMPFIHIQRRGGQ